MKTKAVKRPLIRNGKVYVGAWLDKTVIDKAKEKADGQKRTLSAYMELALAYHNQAVGNV